MPGDLPGERGHLARIATVRADGTLGVVPVWFIFEGDKVLITPRKHSAFLANVLREPRVAITIDEDQGRYRKVLLEGRADVLHNVGEDRKAFSRSAVSKPSAGRGPSCLD